MIILYRQGGHIAVADICICLQVGHGVLFSWCTHLKVLGVGVVAVGDYLFHGAIGVVNNMESNDLWVQLHNAHPREFGDVSRVIHLSDKSMDGKLR